MGRFTTLVEQSAESGNPSDEQRAIESGMKELIGASNTLVYMDQGFVVPRLGIFFGIGIAPYVPSEVKMLDELEHTLRSGAAGGSVAVFSIFDCNSQADFERRFPDAPRILQTPVVGRWAEGVIQEVMQGRTAWGGLERAGLLTRSLRL